MGVLLYLLAGIVSGALYCFLAGWSWIAYAISVFFLPLGLTACYGSATLSGIFNPNLKTKLRFMEQWLSSTPEERSSPCEHLILFWMSSAIMLAPIVVHVIAIQIGAFASTAMAARIDYYRYWAAPAVLVAVILTATCYFLWVLIRVRPWRRTSSRPMHN